MILDCEYTERKDKHGQIEAYGVEWTEARVTAEWVTIKCGLGLLYVGIVGGIIGLAVMLLHITPWLLAFGCACGALGWLFMWEGWRLDGTAHHLAFDRDGTAYTPLRLSTGTHFKDKLLRPHSLIESIESEQLKVPKKDDTLDVYTHGVRVFYTDGSIERIAKNLEPDQAHKLAVRLTLALEKMRAELSATGNGGASRRVAGRREKLHVIN